MNRYIDPARERISDDFLVVQRFLRDPLGLVMVLIGLILIGYGEVNLQYTPLRFPILEAWYGGAFGGVEVLIFVLLLFAVIRRIVARDYEITPSRMTLPILGMGLLLAAIPWVRMIVGGGGFKIPFEANFIPFMVLMFFVWRLVFHPSDVRLIAWMILAATLYKCVEGLLIFSLNTAVWGALTGWRDGMLLALGVSGALIAFVIRPDRDDWYRRFRRVLLLVAPLIAIVFVLAMRRSYFLALALSLPVVFARLRPSERKGLLVALAILSPLLVVGAATFGFDSLSMRIGSISTPTEEGSAAWRLLEFYNVIQMIGAKPFFGWPLGVEFINVTGINLPEINSLMPHNSYLYAMLRGGVVGLIAWVWVLVRMVRSCSSAIRHAPSAAYRFLALWMMTLALMTIFSGVTSPVFASRLTNLIPLCLVLISFLPGAFYRRRGERPSAA